MRTASIALLALAVPLLAAPAPLTEQQARDAAETMTPDTIVVIDAGDGPARTLRYTPTQGAVSTYEARQKITMEITMDDEPFQYNDYPASVCNIDARVTTVNDDGSFVLESTFTVLNAEATTDPFDEGATLLRNTMDAILGRLAGTTITQTIDQRGLERDHAIEAPENSDESMAQRVVQVVRESLVPFPEEPVAPGAAWRIRRELDEGGVQQTFLVTYHLLERTRTEATVEMHANFLLDEQDIGQGSTITGGSGKGLGTITVRLDLAGPAENTQRTDADLVAERNTSGAITVLEQRMTTESTVTLIHTEPADTTSTENK